MPLRSLITYLFCFLIGTVQASESTDGEQQFYDRGRIINKLEPKAYSSEVMLRKIWRKLVDIERRVSYLERTATLASNIPLIMASDMMKVDKDQGKMRAFTN